GWAGAPRGGADGQAAAPAEAGPRRDYSEVERLRGGGAVHLVVREPEEAGHGRSDVQGPRRTIDHGAATHDPVPPADEERDTEGHLVSVVAGDRVRERGGIGESPSRTTGRHEVAAAFAQVQFGRVVETVDPRQAADDLAEPGQRGVPLVV